MFDTKTTVRLANSAEPERTTTLRLPFVRDDLEEALAYIGVDPNGEDGDCDLFSGYTSTTYVVTIVESAYEFNLPDHPDLDWLNDLIEKIEDLQDYEVEILDALIEDGDSIEDAIDNIDDATLYSNMTLAEVAEELAKEECFSTDFLMNYIDWDAVGEALEEDGYVEVSNGVLARY